jgi:hypothetical protein
MKHNFFLIKSAKARVTGIIPYYHGKVPQFVTQIDFLPMTTGGDIRFCVIPPF